MKLVVAVIQPERLEAVQERLGEARVFRLTVSDVQGVSPAPQTAAAAAYAAGSASTAGASAPTRRVKLEIAVNEEFVEPTVRAISEGAQLPDDTPGVGAVWVLPLEEAIRIRTGERGPEAI
ncbi:MAG: P-II family nitrogen regulator [Planctomycetes bacterium]|nr:P-II family nitrogen regulator [Planctomycetota bacterium]